MQHEPFRQRLGQRCHGELLLSLKTERIARKIYRSRNEARADVFDYIERFYNTTRRHSTIGYVSPVEFERKLGLA
jgi:putative transposase